MRVLPCDACGQRGFRPLSPVASGTGRLRTFAKPIEHVEDKTAELIDIYFEQANVFSGIVGLLVFRLSMP